MGHDRLQVSQVPWVVEHAFPLLSESSIGRVARQNEAKEVRAPDVYELVDATTNFSDIGK
jgi:hypothetical protein